MASAQHIRVADLTLRVPGIPWVAGGRDPETGLDCFGLMLLVVRRRFSDAPELALDPWRDGPRAAADDYFARFASRWRRLGADRALATQAGDIILTTSEEGPHVSTLFDAPSRRVITASVHRGVRWLPLELLRDVTDVLRFVPGEPAS